MINEKEYKKRLEVVNALVELLKKTLKFDIVTVTPELAAEWLNKNKKNRRHNRSNSYVTQMIRNMWGFSGQPIIFSDTDLLLDGGGRLNAVVKSGNPIAATVIYNVPESSFALMDSIKSRTFKDVLEASHIFDGEKERVIGRAASITKRLMEWQSERFGSHGSSTTRNGVANHQECLDFTEDNLSVIRECAKASVEMSGAKREKLISKQDYFGSMMAYLIIFKGWDFTDVYRFFDELTSIHSEVRIEGHPIVTLRSYLRREYAKEMHITDEQRFHMFAKAWNDYCKGNEVFRFKLEKSKAIPLQRFDAMMK
jgi:hypothetical protein